MSSLKFLNHDKKKKKNMSKLISVSILSNLGFLTKRVSWVWKDRFKATTPPYTGIILTPKIY